MAEIRPFRGLRYNPAKVPGLGSAIAPPYDVISPDDRDALLQSNPNNIVRVELAQTNDAAAYEEAGRTLMQWRRDGVMVEETRPTFYLARHAFTYMGRRMTRHQVTVALRLEALDAGGVRPHEDTRAGARQDRLSLLRATAANVSPVMLLYEGEGIPAPDGAAPQVAELKNGDRFELWPITDESAVARFQAELSKKPVYIADGHHRYETALRHRDETGAGDGDAASFVMATLISFDDPGMLVLPYHRLLGSLDGAALGAFHTLLTEVCSETQLSMEGATAEAAGRQALECLMARDALFAVWGMAPDCLSLLTLRDERTVDDIVRRGHSRAWSGLANSVFREALLAPILGIDEEEAERRGKLSFAKDAGEAVRAVNEGAQQLAVLCQPVPLQALRELSDLSERLPPKSTFFYPKLPTGLVLRSLEGVA